VILHPPLHILRHPSAAQTGPHVDLCIAVLACEKQENGLYKSKLHEGLTPSSFYHYQLGGAIGCILKLYGTIDLSRHHNIFRVQIEPCSSATLIGH